MDWQPLRPYVWGKGRSKPLWLSIQVNTDPELSPRQQITSVPLAILAESAGALTDPQAILGPIHIAGSDVGIGTANPQAMLHIGNGNGSDRIRVFINSNSAANGTGLEINGVLRLDGAGVPPPPPGNQCVLWYDSGGCLHVTFSNGMTRTLACN